MLGWQCFARGEARGTGGGGGLVTAWRVGCGEGIWSGRPPVREIKLVLRGTIIYRTYDIHDNLCIYPCLQPRFGPLNYGPP